MKCLLLSSGCNKYIYKLVSVSKKHIPINPRYCSLTLLIIGKFPENLFQKCLIFGTNKIGANFTHLLIIDTLSSAKSIDYCIFVPYYLREFYFDKSIDKFIKDI